MPRSYSDQYDLGMEYSGYVEPGGYDRVVFRGDPSIVDGKASEFIAFWVKGGRVLAGMNANVWDVVKPIQNLVRGPARPGSSPWTWTGCGPCMRGTSDGAHDGRGSLRPLGLTPA